MIELAGTVAISNQNTHWFMDSSAEGVIGWLTWRFGWERFQPMGENFDYERQVSLFSNGDNQCVRVPEEGKGL